MSLFLAATPSSDSVQSQRRRKFPSAGRQHSVLANFHYHQLLLSLQGGLQFEPVCLSISTFNLDDTFPWANWIILLCIKCSHGNRVKTCNTVALLTFQRMCTVTHVCLDYLLIIIKDQLSTNKRRNHWFLDTESYQNLSVTLKFLCEPLLSAHQVLLSRHLPLASVGLISLQNDKNKQFTQRG